MTTKIAGKLTILFIFITFLGGCGGPKRDPIPGAKTTAGTTTAGTTTAGTPTGEKPKGETTAGGNTTSGATGAPGGGPPSGTSPPPSAEPAVRFAEVEPLFDTHCMVCHRSTPPVVDWTNYEVAKTYVDNGKLLERVWTLKDDILKGMPMGGGAGTKFSPANRELIKKWIEGGGQE